MDRQTDRPTDQPRGIESYTNDKIERFLSIFHVKWKYHKGEDIPGNKMDSNNLATLFAPNILHSMKNSDGVSSPGIINFFGYYS